MNNSAIKFSTGSTGSSGTNTVNQIGGAVTFYSDAGVTVGGTGTFDTRNVGNGKTVSSTNIALGGAGAGNYTVNNSATTALPTCPVPPRTIAAKFCFIKSDLCLGKYAAVDSFSWVCQADCPELR